MGRQKGWAAAATGRPAMRSPGRPPVARREHRQRFWKAVAEGLSSEDAGVAAGVSPAVGTRWFRESGGMPSITQKPLSGRYLSFEEREEIALLRAQDCNLGRFTTATSAPESDANPGQPSRHVAPPETTGGHSSDHGNRPKKPDCPIPAFQPPELMLPEFPKPESLK